MKGSGLAIVLAVVVLGVAGFWNYDRNEHLDKDLEVRPYAGLSDGDLDGLLEAYEAQAATLQQSLGGGPDDSGLRRIRPHDLGRKVEAFERFQAENRRWKEGHRKALASQVEIDRLRRERKIREAGLDQEWRRILRRVITL